MKHPNRKGKRFQHIIARILSVATGLPIDDFYSCHGGKKERDIRQSEQAKVMWPFHTECKNQKTINMPDWLRQARADSLSEAQNLAPVVIFKPHGTSTPYIVLELEDFLTAIYRLSPEEIQKIREEARGIRSTSD